MFCSKTNNYNDDQQLDPIYPAEARQKMITYDSFDLLMF